MRCGELKLVIAAGIFVAAVPAVWPQDAHAPAARSDVGQMVFEAADVRASEPVQYPRFRGGAMRGDRYQWRDATLVDLISLAYTVDPANVVGGPAWLEFDRFNITALAPPATTHESSLVMLQALLADRFHLKMRAEVQPQPAYLLSAGKVPKLKVSDAAGDGGCGFHPVAKDASPEERAEVHFSCRGMTMEAFAAFLHGMEGTQQPRPVVDATGLKEAWDFDLHWSYGPPTGGANQGLLDAVDKQLGLKLELKTAPLPVILVSGVSEAPTANAAGLAAKLPPAPAAEFDVAVIRPSAPGVKHFSISFDPSGRITIQHASVETLIAYSWDIDRLTILRGANVIDQEFYDVVGKPATLNAAAGVPGKAPPVDPNEIREMVRSLLAERFHLKVHAEEHVFDAYNLAASAAPKMKKADPASRTYCRYGLEPGAKDPRLTNPTITQELVCQNITMAQFTANLRTYAPGNIKTRVLDMTGLTGGYDFAMYWSGENDGYTGLPTTDANGDPNGVIPLADAFSRQLGLKLLKVTRPVEMLAIDHVERGPTEN